MKKEAPIYMEIYKDLKKKILYGTFRDGDRFPAFQTLCDYYHVSLAPVRAAIKMLSEDGYIRTTERGNSTVTDLARKMGYRQWAKEDVLRLEGSYATLNIISMPVMRRCTQLCGPEEWQALDEAICQMEKNLDDIMKYWLANEQFWIIILDKGGNYYFRFAFDSLRCIMESIFLITRETRIQDIQMRKNLVSTMRAGLPLKDQDLNAVFRAHLMQSNIQLVSADPDTRYFKEIRDHTFDHSQPMYTSILACLLQEIETGAYKKGDFLPSAAELCGRYHVSTITVARVSQLLKSLGFVQSRRGKGGGMQLLIGAEELRQTPFGADERHKRVNRFLDCLEYIALTSENVARHVGRHTTFTEIYDLYQKMHHWDEAGSKYTPALALLINFIVSHIQLDGLRVIYQELRKEYSSDDLLSVPRNHDVEKTRQLHSRCLGAVKALVDGDVEAFASACQNIFSFLYQWALDGCSALGFVR